MCTSNETSRSYIHGFRANVRPYSGWRVDDTAVVNVEVKCKSSDGYEETLKPIDDFIGHNPYFFVGCN